MYLNDTRLRLVPPPWISHVKISCKLLFYTFRKLNRTSSLYVPCSSSSEFCIYCFLILGCPSFRIHPMCFFSSFHTQLSRHFLWGSLPESLRHTEPSAAGPPQRPLRTTNRSIQHVCWNCLLVGFSKIEREHLKVFAVSSTFQAISLLKIHWHFREGIMPGFPL